MNVRLIGLGLLSLFYQSGVLAATEAVVSPTGSVLKMVMGLAVVLVVMALISWVVIRMLPNATGQNSVLKVVGGASVGSRERVVVLEVAGRWLVVGVAQGQVSAIANLEVGSDQLTASLDKTNPAVKPNDDAMTHTAYANPIVKPFSEWLKKSAANINNKANRK